MTGRMAGVVLVALLAGVALAATPGRAAAQARGVLQATATVIDIRASEATLTRARNLAQGDTARAATAVLAATRIDILRPRATATAADGRVVVVIQYLY